MPQAPSAKGTKQYKGQKGLLCNWDAVHLEILVEHNLLVQGDSGGSVMRLEGQNYESIGIVSWGVEGCQVN